MVSHVRINVVGACVHGLGLRGRPTEGVPALFAMALAAVLAVDDTALLSFAVGLDRVSLIT